MNEEKIWNYLISVIKNPYGVAGVMGNMNAESALIPNNLQDSYEKKLGYTNVTYTKAVDNGTYSNFIHDGAGYGLVQWTWWTLKRDLLNYAKAKKASVGDLNVQLEFLCKQLQESYPTVWKTLTTASNVFEASNAMLLKFECPADQSITVQQKRAQFGQVYYDKYATSNATAAVSRTTVINANSGGVTIGHASKDENGRWTGGIAGDQTGKEVCVINWYNKPWLAVYRPDITAAEQIAVAMEQACANANVGYNQANRTSLYTAAKAVKWDISKVIIPCDVDCASLVAVCINAAGIIISKDMNTRNADNLIARTGRFQKITDTSYLSNTDKLKRGDILWGEGHMAIVLKNGPKASVSVTQQHVSPYANKGVGTALALETMNVRTGPSTQYKKIGTVAKNTRVEVLSILSNGWYKIVYNCDSGYAYVSNYENQYFEYTGAKQTTAINTYYTVKITADALNIRKGPGLDHPITGVIRDHGIYTIIQENNGWGRLKSGAGWIWLEYTRKISI